MMRLTKATRDQIQILAFVARATPGSIAVSSIAEDLGIPRPNTLKLIGRLVHAGLLCAKRGPGGGVMLAQPAAEIRLGTVIRLLEGANAKPEGSDWPILGSRNKASNILETALALFVEVLDQHTLADLVADPLGLKIGRRQRQQPIEPNRRSRTLSNVVTPLP